MALSVIRKFPRRCYVLVLLVLIFLACFYLALAVIVFNKLLAGKSNCTLPLPLQNSHSDKWQRIDANKADSFVFSAFFDDRLGQFGIVRVMGVSLYNISVAQYCQFWYSGEKAVKIVKVWRQDKLNNPVNRSYPMQILCVLPDDRVPAVVSVVTQQCVHPVNAMILHDSSGHPKHSGSFGICIQSPVFGSKYKAKRYIETFETNRMFGASKIVLYDFSSHENLTSSLQSYVKESVLELVNWRSLPRAALARHLHYYGQQVSMNDCLYRLMGKVTYIAFTDMDEILVPRRANNWKQMLSQLPKSTQDGRRIVTYYFLNTFFSTKDYPSDKEWNANNLVTARSLYRLPPTQRGREKYIVEAKFISYLGVHIVFKMLPNCSSMRLDPKDGMLHHYRFVSNKEGFVKDTYMLRFKDEVIERVTKKMAKTNRSTDRA